MPSTYNYVENVIKVESEMKCDHRSCDCELSNRKLSPKNVFRVSTGFEPMASALALQCSPPTEL